MATRTVENWGGNLRFQPRELAYPANEAELQALIKTAAAKGQKVRVVGTGHSWTHLILTNDVLVSLDRMQGVIEAQPDKLQATVWAGTKLHLLGKLLHDRGMAMENLGDINAQSIAGALGTGTHGTGIRFGVIASQVIALTLVNGHGELVHCSLNENRELFKAAQVSLGMLGIITRVTVQCVPAYNLKLVKARENLHTVLKNIDTYIHQNRNFELYWFPFTDVVQTKCSNETTEAPNHNKVKDYLNDIILENALFKVVSEVSRLVPSTAAGVSKLAASTIGTGVEIAESHNVYATARLVRFMEMEYGVPADKGPETLLAIKAWIDQHNPKVHFPLEYRYVKADDILLSPAHGQDTCFISVHQYKGMPHERYFAGLEEIFLRYGGRPHWGKMHTQTHEYLATRYPQLDAFKRIRQLLDPQGVFLTEYARSIIGPDARQPATNDRATVPAF